MRESDNEKGKRRSSTSSQTMTRYGQMVTLGHRRRSLAPALGSTDQGLQHRLLLVSAGSNPLLELGSYLHHRPSLRGATRLLLHHPTVTNNLSPCQLQRPLLRHTGLSPRMDLGAFPWTMDVTCQGSRVAARSYCPSCRYGVLMTERRNLLLENRQHRALDILVRCHLDQRGWDNSFLLWTRSGCTKGV